jgi:dihydroflavonol-4-reductase
MDRTKKVLVTGANGHVGNNLVKALLERGYRVRASVRDTKDASKTGSLAGTEVELVSLDVRDAGQFHAACADIDILFHVAATYKNYTAGKAEAQEMLRDSLEGTRAALSAAARQRVSRVVMTSSVVTLPLVEPGGRATTEADWRDDFALPYHRAKTLAEQEAWKLAKELGIDLVTVLPGAIIGPGFTRSTSSTDTIETIMLGGLKMGVPDTNLPLVDIRDVINGHLLAAENPATGRFVICNDVLPSFMEVTRLMHAIDPAVPASPRKLPAATMALAPLFDWINHKTLGTPRSVGSELVAAVKGKVWTMSNARAKAVLGWRQQIPLEQSLADTMATLRELRRKSRPSHASSVARA